MVGGDPLALGLGLQAAPGQQVPGWGGLGFAPLYPPPPLPRVLVPVPVGGAGGGLVTCRRVPTGQPTADGAGLFVLGQMSPRGPGQGS